MTIFHRICKFTRLAGYCHSAWDTLCCCRLAQVKTTQPKTRRTSINVYWQTGGIKLSDLDQKKLNRRQLAGERAFMACGT